MMRTEQCGLRYDACASKATSNCPAAKLSHTSLTVMAPLRDPSDLVGTNPFRLVRGIRSCVFAA
jgi:hypothetical protein